MTERIIRPKDDARETTSTWIGESLRWAKASTDWRYTFEGPTFLESEVVTPSVPFELCGHRVERTCWITMKRKLTGGLYRLHAVGRVRTFVRESSIFQCFQASSVRISEERRE